MKLILLLFLLCFALVGCQATLQEIHLVEPTPTVSEYFTTIEAGFLINLLEGYVGSQYFLSLAINKPIPEGAFLEAKFENPENNKKPIIVTKIADSQEDSISLKSPVVRGVENHTDYDIVVNIYSDESKEELLGSHKQVIRSEWGEMRLRR